MTDKKPLLDLSTDQVVARIRIDGELFDMIKIDDLSIMQRQKLTDSGMVFAGFVGRFHMTDRLFHGDLRFTDPGDDPPSNTTSVKAIISPSSSAKPSSQAKPKKSAKPGTITDKGT